MNPRNITWKIGPVPSAEAIHPDSRIIIHSISLLNNKEVEQLVILKPCTSNDSMYKNYWISDKDQLWSPEILKKVHWDWWKSFHNE